MKNRPRRNRSTTSNQNIGNAETESYEYLSEHDRPPTATPAAPHDPVGAILRRWWLPLAGALLGAIIALIAASSGTERYRASSVAAVVPSAAVESTDLLRSVDTLERRTIVATAAELVATVPTRRDAGLTAADESGYTMEARVIPNTNLVRVTVEGVEAARVAAIAAETPQVLGRQLRELFKVYDVQTVSEANPAAAIIGGGNARNVIGGAIAGTLLGALAAIALQFTGRSTRRVHRTVQ